MLPAAARRFRVTDARLAAALSVGGAQLVDGSPDVEIAGRPEHLRGDAPVAVVSLGRPGWTRGSLPARIAKRSAASARVRVQAVAAARALRRLGYPSTETATWDLGHAFRGTGSIFARPTVEYLPQCALVFGRREEAGQSLADAALADAGAATGSAFTPRRLSARGGVMLAFTEQGLVRMAVGPGRRQIREQVDALAVLRNGGAPAALARLVPWPSASGRTGIADWSVEPLLPGASPQPPLADELLAECLDALVALHSVGGPGDPPASLAKSAAVVARVCAEAEATIVQETGRRLDAALGGVPRGFGHGDFHSENLLIDGGRLAGVVDWDSAGPGRLALLDVLHLTLTSRGHPLDLAWGPTLVSELLPWARRGGDALAREYCARVGMDPEPRLLEMLVVAYWLERAASQLASHAEHWEDRDWIDSNIQSVARSLLPGRE